MINSEEKKKVEVELNANYSDATISWADSHVKLPPIINERSYRCGVEIGVAYGNHSDSILSTTKVEHLCGIDPYAHYEKYRHDAQCFEQERQDALHRLVERRLSFYGQRFELLRDFSENCVDGFQDGSLDFVYIDGNHSHEFVKKDIEMWWPKVRPGGMLSGHDYEHPVFPYVTSEVNRFATMNRRTVNFLGAHVWVIYK